MDSSIIVLDYSAVDSLPSSPVVLNFTRASSPPAPAPSSASCSSPPLVLDFSAGESPFSNRHTASSPPVVLDYSAGESPFSNTHTASSPPLFLDFGVGESPFYKHDELRNYTSTPVKQAKRQLFSSPPDMHYSKEATGSAVESTLVPCHYTWNCGFASRGCGESLEGEQGLSAASVTGVFSSQASLSNDVFPTHELSSSSGTPTSMPMPWNFLKVLRMNGCAERCATEKHHLVPSDILRYHDHFTTLPRSARKQWLLDYLIMNTRTAASEEQVSLVVCGKPVCLPLWLSTLGISQSFYYSVRVLYRQGHKRLANQVSRSLTTKTSEALAWMDNFVGLMGDHMPDRGTVHLPSCLSKVSIYQRLVSDLRARNKTEVISQSQFFEIWKTFYGHVSIPKENRFTKCDVCVLLHRELESATDRASREELQKIRTEHNNLQMDQRARYHEIRSKAEIDPSILSIIIDGMDQSATNLPHQKKINKSSVNLWHLRTHFTGAIVHGRGSEGYLDYLQYPHDPNLTINILLRVLTKHFSTLAPTGLPEQLYIQLDNCGRENKNKFVLAFLALLVQEGLFKEVELGFLMVGHTHEDVDALFGHISMWLRKNDALTVPQLLQGITESKSDMRETHVFTEMFDIKAWMSPHMESLHNHSHPHIFRFRKGADGHCYMQYKQWRHSEWEPPSSPGIRVLKSTPTGVPSYVTPNPTKLDLPALKADLPKYAASGLGVVTVQWWNEFVEMLQNSMSAPQDSDVPTTWLLPELLHIKKSSQPRLPVTAHVIPQVSRMRESETCPIPEVYTGSRRQAASKRTATDHSDRATSKRQRADTGPQDHHNKVEKQAAAKRTATSKRQRADTGPQDKAERVKSQSDGPPIKKPPPPSPSTSEPQIGIAEVGEFAATRLAKYDDEIPQIGKVVAIKGCDVTVEWWVGSYSNNWMEWKEKKKVVRETFHRNAIIKSGIKFTSTNRLPQSTVKELKSLYEVVELF